MATAAVVALTVIAALVGVDMAICLVILMLAPAVTVVGYEIQGHRHQAEALAKEGAATPMAHPRVHLDPPLPGADPQ
jgi:hypothetical protein